MRISLDKAEMVLSLMLEGMSIRSIQRITGVHQETILNLLVIAGEKCERLMNETNQRHRGKRRGSRRNLGIRAMQKPSQTAQRN